MPQLLLSDAKGNIRTDPRLGATGMEGAQVSRLSASCLIKLPPGSRLFMLPRRSAIGYDSYSGKFVSKDGELSVAAFLPSGYTATYTAAYREIGKPIQLPLYSYAAVCAHDKDLYATAIRIDKDKRHDCRYIDLNTVRKNVAELSKLFPKNRLVGHLKTCALVHGCPNAQNFFLSRYEAPLPTSPRCNASCFGCISFQPGKRCPASQPRIKFVPTSEELTQIALFHIEHVKDPIVSFGQGCEGEPLLQHRLIKDTIGSIRKLTSKGTIHINSNGSNPEAIKSLISAGLDSARISLNSARSEYYMKYYRPRGYDFDDVMSSIRITKKGGAFVSINYLTMPGFTDIRDEALAFRRLIGRYKVDMVQWRNLNYDPLLYFQQLGVCPEADELLGIKNVISSLKKEFPRVRMGYFNPVIKD